MTENVNIRQVAAERLTYVGVELMRLRRRERGGGAPWRDVARGQGRVIALLKMKPEITQRELTFLLGLTRQSLAELLVKLERQGLIERVPSTVDRRVSVIRLTPAGAAIDQDSDGAPTWIAAGLACLTDEEATALADYLGRIIGQLEAASPDIDARRRRMWEFVQGGGPDGPGDDWGPGGPAGRREGRRPGGRGDPREDWRRLRRAGGFADWGPGGPGGPGRRERGRFHGRGGWAPGGPEGARGDWGPGVPEGPLE